MKIKKDGGFAEAKRVSKTEVGISIGCEHFNPDGTRKDTVINAIVLTEDELVELFRDVFPEEQENKEEKEDLIES